jgi:hypothetical protein
MAMVVSLVHKDQESWEKTRGMTQGPSSIAVAPWPTRWEARIVSPDEPLLGG